MEIKRKNLKRIEFITNVKKATIREMHSAGDNSFVILEMTEDDLKKIAKYIAKRTKAMTKHTKMDSYFAHLTADVTVLVSRKGRKNARRL